MLVGYTKDRVIRDQEFKLKESDFQEKIQAYTRRLDAVQQVNYQLSKDYFSYKHVIGKTKQTHQDDFDLLKVENAALKQELDRILNVAENDTQYASGLYQNKTQNFAQRFRKQSKQNEEDLNIVKVQYRQAQEQYLKELEEVEKNLR